MQHLDPLNPLQSSIIGVLSQNTELDIQSLHRVLKEDCNIQISLPHLYKMVARLLEGQMLVKIRGKLALNMVWVLNAATLMEAIKDTYITNIAQESIFPENDGASLELHGNSLVEFAPMLTHVLLQAIEISGADMMHIYVEYPWYTLGMPEEVEVLVYALKNKLIKARCVYGYDTALTKMMVDRINTKENTPITTLGEPILDTGRSAHIIGDYIVEYTLPNTLRRYMEMYFAATESEGEYNNDEFQQILRMKAKIHTTLERNAKRAAQLREEIDGYFSKNVK